MVRDIVFSIGMSFLDEYVGGYLCYDYCFCIVATSVLRCDF